MRSLLLFKTKLIRLVRPEKGQIYGIHNHSGVCRLSQLRLGLSPLREHRFRRNFFDTTDPMMALKLLYILRCSAKNTLSTEPSSLAKLLPFVRLMELIVIC